MENDQQEKTEMTIKQSLTVLCFKACVYAVIGLVKLREFSENLFKKDINKKHVSKKSNKSRTYY